MEQAIDATEKEVAQAGRAMVVAAFNFLKAQQPSIADEPVSDVASRVVKAIAYVSGVHKEEKKKLQQKYGTDRIYVDASVSSAVATAFGFWITGIDSLDDIIDSVSHESILAGAMLGFAQGLAAARAMNEALDMISDDGMFEFCEVGCIELSKHQK